MREAADVRGQWCRSSVHESVLAACDEHASSGGVSKQDLSANKEGRRMKELTARDFATVILEKFTGKGVARINLNRPEKRNAINQQLIDDVLAALEDVRADKDIRVVVLKGNGPSFCSGLDLYFLRTLE